MTKNTGHKIAAIVLLLGLFSVPFIIDHKQITSIKDSDYMISAAVHHVSTPKQDDSTAVTPPVSPPVTTAGRYASLGATLQR